MDTSHAEQLHNLSGNCVSITTTRSRLTLVPIRVQFISDERVMLFSYLIVHIFYFDFQIWKFSFCIVVRNKLNHTQRWAPISCRICISGFYLSGFHVKVTYDWYCNSYWIYLEENISLIHLWSTQARLCELLSVPPEQIITKTCVCHKTTMVDHNKTTHMARYL